MSRPSRKALFSAGRLVGVYALILGLFVSGALGIWLANLHIPDLTSFEERVVAESTKIYDRTGEILLFDVHENIKRTVVPFGEISRHAKNAAIAIEDANFYNHSGIAPKAIVRAIISNVREGNLLGGQGGSTITQQVVKNSLLSREKTITRKIKEWVLALKIERALSKDDILELYLNETPYGGNLYGVEEASRAFFGVASRDLSIAQAAYLAALPQAPTYFSPYGNHRDELDARKDLVLRRMRENGFITGEEHQRAREEIVDFLPQTDVGIKAPHFVFYVRELLEEKYGKRALEEGGLTVVTSLDFSLQAKAEEIVKRHALQNKEKFNAENAGLVAIDPKTGEILVMVGSRDYFDEEIDGNFNITLAKRQPGSAFKPFVYATAFKRGYTPETVVFDVQTEFSTECTPEGDERYGGAVCYRPNNYDFTFKGPLSLRDALAQSVNVPAIKVLYLAGIEESLRTARDLGITSLRGRDRYGLTLVLGGGEVSPLEMTSAYGVFANDGVRNQHAAILRVEDAEGGVLEEFTPSPKTALSADVARTVSSILSDNAARAPAFGADSLLNFSGRSVAVKTGTTNDFRDAWIVGYSKDVAVGAWAGNNDNSPMAKKVAGFIITPLWREFMDAVIEKTPLRPFEPPPKDPLRTLKPILRGVWRGGQTYTVDTITGKLATEYTPEETREERAFGEIHSILRWVDKDNPLGPPPALPARDPQYELWEFGVRNWARANTIGDIGNSVVPTEVDDVHRPEFRPRLTLKGLESKTPYALGGRVTLAVKAEGEFMPLSEVSIFVNDAHIGTTSSQPFAFSFSLNDLPEVRKKNTIRVIGYDRVRNSTEITAVFLVN